MVKAGVIVGGTYWSRRAINARPRFGHNGQAILIAVPLFAALKWKNALHSNNECILRPENAPKCICDWGSAPDPAGELTELPEP